MMICSAAKFASGSEVEIIGSTKYGPASDYIARAANKGYSGAPMSRSAFIGYNCKLGYVGHRLPRLLEIRLAPAPYECRATGSAFVPTGSINGQRCAFERVSPPPFLTFEQRAKRDGDLQVLIALVSRRKCPRIAQDIAPQFGQFIEAVETLDAGIDGSH
jgi:hypothetical protein